MARSVINTRWRPNGLRGLGALSDPMRQGAGFSLAVLVDGRFAGGSPTTGIPAYLKNSGQLNTTFSSAQVFNASTLQSLINMGIAIPSAGVYRINVSGSTLKEYGSAQEVLNLLLQQIGFWNRVLFVENFNAEVYTQPVAPPPPPPEPLIDLSQPAPPPPPPPMTVFPPVVPPPETTQAPVTQAPITQAPVTQAPITGGSTSPPPAGTQTPPGSLPSTQTPGAPSGAGFFDQIARALNVSTEQAQIAVAIGAVAFYFFFFRK